MEVFLFFESFFLSWIDLNVFLFMLNALKRFYPDPTILDGPENAVLFFVLDG